MDLNKIIQYAGYGLVGIGALFGILFFLGAIGGNGLLILTYILIAMATVLTLLFSIVGIATNPKGALGMLVSLAVLGILVLITYFGSSNEIPTSAGGTPLDVTPGTSQWVGSLIGISGILLAVAIVGIFSSPIFKLFRK